MCEFQKENNRILHVSPKIKKKKKKKTNKQKSIMIFFFFVIIHLSSDFRCSLPVPCPWRAESQDLPDPFAASLVEAVIVWIK